ncbi:TPA: hypothetical protein N2D31_005562 [Pseudomonas aeruginosa]|nr:hypothetical protein [Pseudomonas aeruginosa]
MSNEDWNELDESYRSALSGALETAHPAVEQVGGDERAAFESRAEDAGSDISRDDFGNYVNVYVQTEWEGWQARAALASTPVADESPMAKMADALREKARQEQQAYQDRRNQATEWGPMPEGTEADRLISTAPVAHVAGDETSRYLEWAKDRSAWEMPVGTPVYYAALAQPSPTLPPFAEKVLAKLRRFYDCAEDFESGGVDIGRHWLDLLTQLGLLNRVQRSPALWEISQQGEDLLGTPHPSPAPADEKPGDSILCSGCFAKGVGPEHFDEAGKCLVRQQTEPLGAEFAQVLSDNLPELLSTAQAEQAEAERSALWAVHAQGPDELYAAFSREDAEKHAAELNALPMPEGIAVGAVVVPSPWPAVQHWQYLAEQEQDHKNEIAGRLRQLERICEGLPQDAIDGGWTVQGIRGYAKRLEDQLKAALARVAELERQEPVAWMHDQPNRVDVIHRDVKDLLQRVPGSSRGIHRPLDVSEHYTIPLYAAPVAQAQHSVPEGWRIERSAERIVVMNLKNGAGYAAARDGESGIAESVLYLLAADLLAAAPGKEGV